MTGLQRFRDLVAAELGLQFEAARTAQLAETLARRARAGALSEEAYLARLAAGASVEERRALARELTIGETFFFRDAGQLAALAALAHDRRSGPARPLRVLSAGCATGEEPYSIAMVLSDVLPPRGFSVRAVDVDAAALERARRGRYSEWSLRETPDHARSRFFRRDADAYVLDPALRALVSFEERNLAADDVELWPAGAYDVVFCRNVLMYFTPDHARAVVARAHRAIALDGHLFVGHAETLRGLSPAFRLCHSHGAFYYRRAAAASSAETEAAQPAEWPAAVAETALRIESLVRESPARSPETARGALAALVDGERFTEALALLDGGGSETDGGDVRLLRASLLAQAGRFEEAERACRALIEDDALAAGAYYLLALCSVGAGDGDAALRHDRTAAHLDPSFAMPRLHLGLLARRRGDREAAARALAEAALLLHGEDAERLRLFGGGFGREALLGLCRAELAACGSDAR